MSETEALQKRFAAAIMPNYGMPPVAISRGAGCLVTPLTSLPASLISFSETTSMMDLLYVAVTLGFFALALVLLVGWQRTKPLGLIPFDFHLDVIGPQHVKSVQPFAERPEIDPLRSHCVFSFQNIRWY